ncbi:YrdB family protein [Nocardia sp. NPDC057668]|uniref:YrdB family protein n=1 Tax=Nocardia sp. NPDC057668 TaxID=3346202 RepID=UPI003670AC0E
MSALRGANLLVMFALELTVLGSAAFWGATVPDPVPARIFAAVAVPTVFIVVWSFFGAAADARYPQTGWRRALLELVWFGGGAVLLGWAWTPWAGVAMFAVWAVNGVLRVVWGQVGQVP